MRKLLLALSILTLPITANAQTPPKQVPEAIVQTAIQEFVGPWCKTGYMGLITNIQNCYNNISPYDPEIDRCILGDTLLQYATNVMHAFSQETGQPDSTANIPFATRNEMDKRLRRSFDAPQYKQILNSPPSVIIAYIAPGRQALIQALRKKANQCTPPN